MARLIETLVKLIKVLNERGVKYCVIGGLALNLYGIMRRTEDIDLFLSPESANLERAINCLRDVFQDEELMKLDISDFREYPVIRYGTPEGFHIDLMTRAEEALSWAEVESSIEWRELGDLKVPVPSIDMLIRMKEGASLFRERDRADLSYLYRLKERGSGGPRREDAHKVQNL